VDKLDDYEIRLQQSQRMFADARAEDRRTIERRSSEFSERRQTRQDRRQRLEEFAEERRKQDRRGAERRIVEDRRVSSDWSHQRFQEEKKKLNRRKYKQVQFWMIVGYLLAIIMILFFISSCTKRVSCGYETVSFLGLKFNSPIPQKCSERPNQATDIVGF
jgi:hypothetical protein